METSTSTSDIDKLSRSFRLLLIVKSTGASDVAASLLKDLERARGAMGYPILDLRPVADEARWNKGEMIAEAWCCSFDMLKKSVRRRKYLFMVRRWVQHALRLGCSQESAMRM